MIQYKAIVPIEGKTDKDGNPLQPYNGKTFGVRFDNNKAVFSEASVNKALGLTAEEIASRMVADFGYAVFVIDEAGKETPFASKKRKARASEGVPEGA